MWKAEGERERERQRETGTERERASWDLGRDITIITAGTHSRVHSWTDRQTDWRTDEQVHTHRRQLLLHSYRYARTHTHAHTHAHLVYDAIFCVLSFCVHLLLVLCPPLLFLQFLCSYLTHHSKLHTRLGSGSSICVHVWPFINPECTNQVPGAYSVTSGRPTWGKQKSMKWQLRLVLLWFFF